MEIGEGSLIAIADEIIRVSPRTNVELIDAKGIVFNADYGVFQT